MPRPSVHPDEASEYSEFTWVVSTSIGSIILGGKNTVKTAYFNHIRPSYLKSRLIYP